MGSVADGDDGLANPICGAPLVGENRVVDDPAVMNAS
jgi:hypothetical protein